MKIERGEYGSATLTWPEEAGSGRLVLAGDIEVEMFGARYLLSQLTDEEVRSYYVRVVRPNLPKSFSGKVEPSRRLIGDASGRVFEVKS